MLRRKQHLGPAEVAGLLEDIIRLTHIADVGLAQIRRAWEIAGRHHYGHYDSLIVATALSAGCSVLYTEDMQNGQVFDGRLTLVDPFQEPSAVLQP